MISVKNLSKSFGPKLAVDSVSFEVKKGEVLGFLGPNGAGKSTTMRMVTGYLPPTSGEVEIDGINVVENPIQAKQKIGYLPESAPLYSDMTVSSFLSFAAEIRGKKSTDVESAIETCFLEPVKNQSIDTLSKGYRHRTCLAQSILHDPEILILDEPTGYMDAESIRLTWDLLKKIKGEKSIIYVSNSLSEIENAHDRILVFHEGRILMDGHLDKLLKSTMDYHQFQIEFNSLDEKLYQQLKNIPTVVSPNRLDNIFHFYARTRTVFFDVIKVASEHMMVDLNVKKLGLRDLLDSEFAGKGLD